MQQKLFRIIFGSKNIACFRKCPGKFILSNYYKIRSIDNEYPLWSTPSKIRRITQKLDQVKTTTNFNINMCRYRKVQNYISEQLFQTCSIYNTFCDKKFLPHDSDSAFWLSFTRKFSIHKSFVDNAQDLCKFYNVKLGK